MRTIITFALALAVTSAAAQGFMEDWPRTINLISPDGKKVGTATLDKNRAYLRDAKGVLIGTLVKESENKSTFYDPNGKEVERSPDQDRQLRELLINSPR